MTSEPFSPPSFMAPVGSVADWRLVLVYDSARTSGLLDVLPATVEDAAARTGLDPLGVRAVLDLLTAAGVMRRHGDVVTLADGAPDGGVAVQLSQHASAIRRWAAGIGPALRGDPPTERPPLHLSDWLAAMAVNAESQADAVADAVTGHLVAPGSPPRALDLGGGHGRYAAALAARGYDVTLLDRADVVAVVEEEGWLAGTGVHLVAGDFHQELPDGPFDAVLALGIMHTMSPDRASALVARVAHCLRPGGVLAIRTRVRDGSPSSALFAVQMLVQGRGGDTHRLDDITAWLRAAGMGDPEVMALDTGSLLVSTRL